MSEANTPVIVGVGQWQQKISDLTAAVEPLDMMYRALELAERDTGVENVLSKAQSVRVIKGVWDYANPARYLAERLGCPNVQTVGTPYGGNYVQFVLNHTCAAIVAGELDLAVLTGAENGYSSGKAAKQGKRLPQRQTPGEYDLTYGADQQSEHHEYERALGIQRAVQVYPMYDNALRYQRGESIAEHRARISALWAGFSDVASRNPNAWLRTPVTAVDIARASPSNRQISFPYTKLMNSNLSVDMSAAIIVMSVARARTLGIEPERWIYPQAGAIGNDHFSASVRDNFHSSPGIRLVGARALELAGVSAQDLDLVDLYSCFPAAVQIAAQELGLSEERELTVTGGLTFGGGPLNNYVMHSIARTVELLRTRRAGRALVTANGGNLYKHAHCIYSGEPPAEPFRFDNVQAQIDALPARICLPKFTGSVTVESYTVMFDAEGPTVGHVACRTSGGERVWANVDAPDVLAAMQLEEFCGRAGQMRGNQLSFSA